MNSPQDQPDRTAQMLDNLAAFLMRHAYDEGTSDAERLKALTLVKAFHEGDDDPLAVESAMRAMSLRFAARPDYRDEWRPEPRSDRPNRPLCR
jgi:hypothetical protein